MWRKSRWFNVIFEHRLDVQTEQGNDFFRWRDFVVGGAHLIFKYVARCKMISEANVTVAVEQSLKKWWQFFVNIFAVEFCCKICKWYVYIAPEKFMLFYSEN